jgi:selenocysteine lyase/cysteine desulfurase
VLDDTRRDLAAFLGDAGGGSRIAVMQSATDGLNTLIAALPPGTIVTTAEEHGSALLPVWRRGELDSTVRIVSHRDDASFLAEVERAVAAGASGLVISLVSCKSGKVLPVREACAIARGRGAFTIVDAAQATGQVPVDVRDLGADAVVILGHKWLHGPLATGAIWVAEPTRLLPPRLGWRSREKGEQGRVELYPDARRFETGTVDVAAYVGLRQALVVHRLLGADVGRRVTELRAGLIERLSGLPFDLVSRRHDPTGIVVVAPRSGGALDIVTAMWQNERIVVKHLSEPGWPDAIRISFWALHEAAAIERLGIAFERVMMVAA